MARRRRRSRAKENPGAGLIIALVAGAAAIGGIAYVMTRPSTSTTPAAAAPTLPVLSTTPVTLNASVNGRAATWTHTPDAANAATDVQNALTLANAGHGPGAEGEVWVQNAIADGANAAQLAQLTAAGYTSV